MFADEKLKDNIETHVPELDTVMWEYKWKNADESEIHGPFSSTQMAEWVDNRYVQKRFCLTLLTLGVHVQRGLEQLSCVFVCVSVCYPYSANQAIKRPAKGSSGFS